MVESRSASTRHSWSTLSPSWPRSTIRLSIWGRIFHKLPAITCGDGAKIIPVLIGQPATNLLLDMLQLLMRHKHILLQESSKHAGVWEAENWFSLVFLQFM
ncbi:hypothetical protein E2C01_000211 [Portunus trituberculatus]|uniref:Uncharacterized protein n=1 Tax=Portunus trituberculatus TaxID=210409 RepID=A0A5B7CE26_PORTR|nr:hypothetical protein [Portunus trituberculatus]